MSNLSHKLRDYYWDICKNIDQFKDLDDSTIQSLKELLVTGATNLIQANASIEEIEKSIQAIQKEGFLEYTLSNNQNNLEIREEDVIDDSRETHNINLMSVTVSPQRCRFWPFCW